MTDAIINNVVVKQRKPRNKKNIISDEDKKALSKKITENSYNLKNTLLNVYYNIPPDYHPDEDTMILKKKFERLIKTPKKKNSKKDLSTQL
jgi:hypothetical protein